MPAALTPIEAFLAPLAKLALKQPEIEGLVFWGDANGWDASPTEALESEEIAFYAEGLLLEGFRMVWEIAAMAETPTDPDHIRLLFWQDTAPPVPAPPPAWVTITRAEWTSK